MNDALFISKLKLTCQLSIIDNRSVSEEILRELMSISNSSKVKTRISIVLGEIENVKISELTFNQCFRLVKKRDCSDRILEEAYKYWKGRHGEDHELIQEIARHLNTPTHILSELIVDWDNWRIRQAAAGNPNTLTADLEVCLKNDDDTDVLLAAVCNPSTPIEAIVALSMHEDPDRRWVAASSPNLPAVELDRLVDDESGDVYEQAIENPNLAIETKVWIVYSGKFEDTNSFLVEDDIENLIKKNPEMRSRVEELKAMVELGVRPTLESINLDEINI